ncbi:MAG: SH3 domain-containing protein [Firmicutes bacterium]|nr:SH3 domain-containing protein [Bacillota bacterium]
MKQNLLKKCGRLAVVGLMSAVMLVAPNAVLVETAVAAEFEEIEVVPYFNTTANTRLRSGPSLGAEVLATVAVGSNVAVFEQISEEWFAVAFNGVQGFMEGAFLEAPVVQLPPVTANNLTTPQVNINGVELVSWWDAKNNLIRTRVPLHITDVGTGITFWVESFSNGNHADVVTLTTADTDALRRAFGGRWSWDTRAILVTVDGRTYAASISGMPHGGNGGNFSNGVNGQFCIHFLESRTHNGNRSHEREHQASVLEAFNLAR